jgi:hypothetical protein
MKQQLQKLDPHAPQLHSRQPTLNLKEPGPRQFKSLMTGIAEEEDKDDELSCSDGDSLSDDGGPSRMMSGQTERRPEGQEKGGSSDTVRMGGGT